MLSRRRWLGAGVLSFAAGTASTLRAQSSRDTPLTKDEEGVVAAVRGKAEKAGLGPCEVRWTEHFLGVGDAPPEQYIARAVELCESFARDFLPHFRDRDFAVDFPRRRMTVVALKDAGSYQSYSGVPREQAVGGHYDPDTNELVVFDFRPDQGNLAARAKRVNTFTLVHETAHLLCYNTGLLPTGRDVPVAISEGFATYAELWTPPRDRTAFGRINGLRLDPLDESRERWIPVARLLTEDRVFYDQKTENQAYAEAWLLVRYLLRQLELFPGFRAYLAEFPKPDAGAGREAYAESKVGSLRDLDAKVRRSARGVRPRRR